MVYVHYFIKTSQQTYDRGAIIIHIFKLKRKQEQNLKCSEIK